MDVIFNPLEEALENAPEWLCVAFAEDEEAIEPDPDGGEHPYVLGFV